MRLSESAYDRSLNLSSHDQLNQRTVLYDSVVVWGNFDIFENPYGLVLGVMRYYSIVRQDYKNMNGPTNSCHKQCSIKYCELYPYTA